MQALQRWFGWFLRKGYSSRFGKLPTQNSERPKIIFLSLGLLHARQSTSVVCEDVKLTATVLRRGGIVYRISFKKTKGETGEKEDPSDGGKTAG